MFLHHRPIKTVITGKSGSGKTSYFQRLIENGFQSYWKTVFLYDWQGEMSERLNISPCFSIEQLPEALKTGFVCYDPSQDFEDDYENGLDFFAKWSFEICKASDEYPLYPRLFCCDEIQLLLPNQISPEIQAILQTGRRRGMDMAVVSQQLNELHNRLRSQSTERVTFQHEDLRVLDVMESWGFNPSEVSSLNVGEYLYRNDRGAYSRKQLFSAPLQPRQEPQSGVDKKEQEP